MRERERKQFTRKSECFKGLCGSLCLDSLRKENAYGRLLLSNTGKTSLTIVHANTLVQTAKNQCEWVVSTGSDRPPRSRDSHVRKHKRS